MAVPAIPPLHLQAIKLIEKIKAVGFPNKETIGDLEALVQELQEISEDFEVVHQLSVKQISKIIQKMKGHIAKKEEVPVPEYTSLYAQLVMLKTNLIP